METIQTLSWLYATLFLDIAIYAVIASVGIYAVQKLIGKKL